MSSYQSEPRKLSEEELQRSVERLTRNTRAEVKLRPLVPQHTISQADLEKRIRILYDDAIAHRQQGIEELTRQRDAAINRDSKLHAVAKISPEEEEQMVQRLYSDSVGMRDRNLESLYVQCTAGSWRADKRFNARQEKEITDRLYREGMERERNKRIKLYEQFVVNRRAPPTRRTRAQLAESSDRMMKSEVATS